MTQNRINILCIQISKLKADLKNARGDALEEAAKVAEKIFPPIHTYSSENSERYHVQDETIKLVAAKLRAMKGKGDD